MLIFRKLLTKKYVLQLGINCKKNYWGPKKKENIKNGLNLSPFESYVLHIILNNNKG